MEEMILKIANHFKKVIEIKEKHNIPRVDWQQYLAEKDAPANNTQIVKNFETRNL